MKNELINWGELSRFLSGHRKNIGKDRIPKKYQEPVSELQKVVEQWKEKHKSK